MPCWPPNCGAPPKEPELPGCADCATFGLLEVPSPEGRDLLRPSVNCVCDDEGVPDGEFEAPSDGDEVPELESFFLADFSLFARESYCAIRVSVYK
jgi:hypothetical protein